MNKPLAGLVTGFDKKLPAQPSLYVYRTTATKIDYSAPARNTPPDNVWDTYCLGPPKWEYRYNQPYLCATNNGKYTFQRVIDLLFRNQDLFAVSDQDFIKDLATHLVNIKCFNKREEGLTQKEIAHAHVLFSHLLVFRKDL